MAQQVNIEALKFERIETTATLRGQKITSDYWFREPVGMEELRRIDAALARAFPEGNCMTEGTIFPYNPYSITIKR